MPKKTLLILILIVTASFFFPNKAKGLTCDSDDDCYDYEETSYAGCVDVGYPWPFFSACEEGDITCFYDYGCESGECSLQTVTCPKISWTRYEPFCLPWECKDNYRERTCYYSSCDSDNYCHYHPFTYKEDCGSCGYCFKQAGDDVCRSYCSGSDTSCGCTTPCRNCNASDTACTYNACQDDNTRQGSRKNYYCSGTLCDFNTPTCTLDCSGSQCCLNGGCVAAGEGSCDKKPGKICSAGNWIAHCGNGICDCAETNVTCPADCNKPPTAAISCDVSRCGPGASGCTGYTKCLFTMNNDSTDPNGQSDINKSEWDILNWGAQPDLTCSSKCNYTLPVMSAGNYKIRLKVTDKAGASSTVEQSFTLKQDIIADFVCSLDNINWKNCDDSKFKPIVGEIIYFSDKSSPSDGATILKRVWEKNRTSFNSDNNSNASTTVSEIGSVEIKLTVTDSIGREDNQAYNINVVRPLPKWREVIPR